MRFAYIRVDEGLQWWHQPNMSAQNEKKEVTSFAVLASTLHSFDDL